MRSLQQERRRRQSLDRLGVDLIEHLLWRAVSALRNRWGRECATYGSRLDLIRLRHTNAGPHDEMRVGASLGRLLVALDALLEREARLVVLHDVVGRDGTAVDVRGPEVGLEGLVVRVAALGRLPAGLDEHLLHLVRVLALGREEEARAEHDAVRAEREQRGGLRAGRDGAGGDDGRAVGDRGAHGGDEVEERGRVRAAVASGVVACGRARDAISLAPYATPGPMSTHLGGRGCRPSTRSRPGSPRRRSCSSRRSWSCARASRQSRARP